MWEVPSEVTEDADVGELFAVAVSGEGEQEGPLQAHEAPHTGQVEAPRVGQGLLVVDGNRQERDEGYDCQQREEDPDDEEELEAPQPGPPVVLQVHDVGDQGPECQYT